MVGWHHQLNRRKFEQAPGNSEGQESLACCKELDTTKQLNNNILSLTRLLMLVCLLSRWQVA